MLTIGHRNIMLSQHFSQTEAEKSQTALGLGIHNSIPEPLMPSVRNVAEQILEPVRTRFGTPFSPSSWYRSASLCKAIGSSAKSQHTRGEAVDFSVPGHTTFEVAQWIMQNLMFDQLILEHYIEGEPRSGWVHCSLKLTGENRRQVLRYDGKMYRTGLMEVT